MSFLHQHGHSLHHAAKQWLRQWTKPDNHALALNAGLDLIRCESELVLANALLRQPLIVLERKNTRPQRA